MNIKILIVALGCIAFLSGATTQVYADDQVGIISGNYAQIFPKTPAEQGYMHIAEPRQWFFKNSTTKDNTIEKRDSSTIPFSVTSKNTSMTASAYMADSFYPHSFLGWLWVIILTIIIMLLSRKFFYKPMHHGH